ncbi:IIC component [Paenibacillus popilliae ATCC 14706]|uniref:IIC component n=2 Tax=Paenibacillus popilliae TaxID=78057 RepID=M9LPX9_PAEPP|nr:IIC component [Paenibacillus popilliae ATCC 14706]
MIIIAFFIIGMESYFSPRHPNFFSAYFYAHGAGADSFLAGVFPLAVTLLVGHSLAWDRKTGFYNYGLIRTNYRRFIGGKFIAAAITSFILVCVTELLAFAYAVLRYPTYDISHIQIAYALPLYKELPFVYILLIIFNTVLAAICFSFLSITLSTLLTNIYLVVALPWLFAFLLQFFLYIISEIKYAPLDLLGIYMIRTAYHYSIFEIAIVWGGTALFLVIITFSIYAAVKFKVRESQNAI